MQRRFRHILGSNALQRAASTPLRFLQSRPTIINTTINSFDFTYCLIVNLLTYFVIKIIDELNKDKEVETWIKRVVLVVCILLTGVVYYITGQDVRLLFNSAILAPVAWSWVFRPIFKKLGIGYKEIDNTINK